MDQVHLILERYIAIHEKIFKFSLRKAIPIPGLFKPIDYGQHFVELNSLVSALEEVADSANNGTQATSASQQYVTALLNIMKVLRDMCKRLYDKSQGNLKNYSIDQYESDVTTYHGLLAKYRSLGLKFNEYNRK
jgi:hypothetical protein